jgi:hypothetical protein
MMMETTQAKSDDDRISDILEKIAIRELFVETLKRRNSDSLDFHDTAVWSMSSALRAAYEAGRKDGKEASA